MKYLHSQSVPMKHTVGDECGMAATCFVWVRFQVLTPASMKITVFCDVAPCSRYELTDVSEVFTSSIIKVIVLVMEAVSTSETSVNFYKTTWRKHPKKKRQSSLLLHVSLKPKMNSYSRRCSISIHTNSFCPLQPLIDEQNFLCSEDIFSVCNSGQ
jgi:hypothetical protein